MAVLHLSTPLDSLGITKTVVEAASPAEEADKWFSAFVEAVRMSDIASIIDLFHETGSWRDIVALTWSLRTLRGRKDIKRLLDARFEATGLTTLQLNKGVRYAPARVAPLPDLAFIRFCFTFETLHGKGSGVCHLVRSSPSPEGSWKAHALLTHLDTLKSSEAGVFRSRMMFHGSWEDKRNHELEFSNGDPDVLIIGAGQCGLQIAAHLKYMGVSTLVIERNARVGDNWRTRYKSLFLHNLIHYNQTSYLRFPSTWPLFSPAPKDCYRGRVVHSSEYKTGSGYEGMKAIVVGACNSAHDIALDLCNNDTDVTIIQRSSTFVISHQALAAEHGVTYNDGFPTELADLLGLALPWSTQKSILQYKVPRVAGTTDKALLKGLERVGFKTNLGPDRTGVITLSSVRGGGFYINTGASEKIIDGSIKLKSECSIERFTTNGLALHDGTELQADIVIFATGFGDLRDSVRLVCGEEVAEKVGLVWGMDDEGELRSVWKDSGHEGFWIAAEIKASLEGLFRREELTF
ncbi:hypothetical protein AZE42_07823 [Rhizopogon vesiculosus]|uniref:PH domain-containing protein n=1 Tax=Rhizopogon vesiculosus TaxID=180088 RepID=A0A1J8QFH3_9AGAM|nr:hypothetical protein AZE42_07823 [Rhizopogon vesiculosus]